MRIARVLTRLNLGGPARQTLASDPRLRTRGHEVRVFAGTSEPGEGDLTDELRARGVDVVRVPGLARGISALGDLRAARFLRRELAAFRPDVLHTHASKAGLLGRRALGRALDAASVHTFHGHVLEGYFKGPLSRALVAHERRMARKTDRVVAVSHATADDLVRLGVVDEERIVVIPPGVELDALLAIENAPFSPRKGNALRALVGAGDDAALVGVVGRLAEVKRPELALAIVELLGRRYPNLQLVFVGDGSLRRTLERRIEALPADLSARVHLVGARTDMPEVLAGLDVVLMTSRSEGLPVALVEAGAAARPVVAMDVGGVSEVVAHERTGFLGETSDELAYGLARILDEPRTGVDMGLRARLRVAKRHAAERLADNLEALYEAVVEEHACAS